MFILAPPWYPGKLYRSFSWYQSIKVKQRPRWQHLIFSQSNVNNQVSCSDFVAMLSVVSELDSIISIYWLSSGLLHCHNGYHMIFRSYIRKWQLYVVDCWSSQNVFVLLGALVDVVRMQTLLMISVPSDEIQKCPWLSHCGRFILQHCQWQWPESREWRDHVWYSLIHRRDSITRRPDQIVHRHVSFSCCLGTEAMSVTVNLQILIKFDATCMSVYLPWLTKKRLCRKLSHPCVGNLEAGSI